MLRSKTMLSVSVAAILSLAASALPAAAQDQAPAPSAPPPSSSAPSTGAPSTAAPMHHGYRQRTAEAVEARIARLHKQLQITPEQETQWNAVAQTMRDNAKATAEMMRQAEQNEPNMSAVDDLKSYAQIAETHAQGVAKLADAFSALYSTMSDSQKKVADQVFRHHRRHPRHHRS